MTIKEDNSGYRIESEIGRLEVVTHRSEKGSRTVYNTKIEIFPKIGPKEMFQTSCFEDLKFRLVSYMPYRKAEEIGNRLRWQDNEEKIKYRTIGDAVSREGADIIDYIDAKAKQILVQSHFDVKSGNPDEKYVVDKDIEFPIIQTIPVVLVKQAIIELNEGKEQEYQIDEMLINEVFEDVEHSVNISVDDVG
ncbi:MAG: hypothetical protein IMZ47_09625, partial [Firmicutes bacterium]|nr:hypothetical protein [Bacillota bacterium]